MKTLSCLIRLKPAFITKIAYIFPFIINDCTLLPVLLCVGHDYSLQLVATCQEGNHHLHSKTFAVCSKTFAVFRVSMRSPPRSVIIDM